MDGWGNMVTQYESRDLWIAGIALVLNFAALVFVGVELYRARTASRKEDIRRAREATLDYYSSTLQERNNLRDALPKPANVTSENEDLVIRYLGYWEAFAAGVNLGVYDLTCACRIAGFRIETIWGNWRPFIEDRRRKSGRPRLYIELQDLAEVISASRSNTG
jgi:hypothetical protein